MSVESTQRELNQIDKDIASIEKKIAEYTKKESECLNKIGDIRRSITKTTSASTASSKMRQIESLTRDQERAAKSHADEAGKLSEKRTKRGTIALKLQHEQTDADKQLAKKQEQRLKNMQDSYENEISRLRDHLQAQLVQDSTAVKSVYDDRSSDEEFDVLVSHATEDKESFANEFVDILTNEYHLKVWYDALSIAWGDSIHSRIDEGLKKCKFGVVVLSRDYIKKYWTRYELEGLFQRESHGGKLILPIWHNITKKEVEEFSPSLADRNALNTAIMSPHEIAKALVILL